MKAQRNRTWPWVAWFVFCALLALAVLAVGLWAVIRVVNHFT